jgi:RNA polymerase sigma factor (sigma-70 family)
VAREISIDSDDIAFVRSMLASDSECPSRYAMKNEQSRLLKAAIEKLPASYRLLIELRQREQYSFEAIGARIQKSAPAARKMWARAVKRLHHELSILDPEFASRLRS